MFTITNSNLEPLLQQEETPLMKLLRSDLPVAFSFRLTQLSKALPQALDSYQEVKRKIVLKYCDKQEGTDEPVVNDGNFSFNDPEQHNGFLTEFQELLGMETEIQCDKPTVDVSKIEGVMLSAADIAQLEPFIEFTDEQK